MYNYSWGVNINRCLDWCERRNDLLPRITGEPNEINHKIMQFSLKGYELSRAKEEEGKNCNKQHWVGSICVSVYRQAENVSDKERGKWEKIVRKTYAQPTHRCDSENVRVSKERGKRFERRQNRHDEQSWGEVEQCAQCSMYKDRNTFVCVHNTSKSTYTHRLPCFQQESTWESRIVNRVHTIYRL